MLKKIILPIVSAVIIGLSIITSPISMASSSNLELTQLNNPQNVTRTKSTPTAQAFSPDGSLLISSGLNGAYIYKVSQEGVITSESKLTNVDSRDVDFSPRDNIFIIVNSDKTLLIYKVNDGQPTQVGNSVTVGTTTGPGPYSLSGAFSKDGNWYSVSAGSDGIWTFHVNNDGTLELVGTVSAPQFDDMDYSKDGTFLTGVRSGTNLLFSYLVSPNGQLTFSQSLKTGPSAYPRAKSLSFSPTDNSLVIVANRFSDGIATFRISSDGKISLVGRSPSPYLAIDPNSKCGWIGGFIEDIEFSPNGMQAAAVMHQCNSVDSHVAIFNIDMNGQPSLSTIATVNNTPNRVAYSQDGNFLSVLIGGAGGIGAVNNVMIFNVTNPSNIIKISESNINMGYPGSAAFSPDKSMIATIYSGTDLLSVSNLDDEGNILSDPSIFNVGQSPKDVVFSPDGKLIAVSSSNDRVIVTFSVENNIVQRKETIWVPDTSVFLSGMAFSPDSKTLAIITGNPSIIYIYQVTNTKDLIYKSRIEMPASLNLTSIYPSFSSNGSLLAVPGADDNVRIFSVSSEGDLTLYNTIPDVAGGNARKFTLFSPDSKYLLATTSASADKSALFEFDDNHNVINRFEIPQTVSSATFINNDTFVTGQSSKELNVYKINSTGISLEYSTPIAESPQILRSSLDGKIILAPLYSAGKVLLFGVNNVEDPSLNNSNSSGQINVLVDSSISLTLNDDTVDLSDIPGATEVITDDNEMNYIVTTNNLEGYTVTIKADNSTLDSATVGNTDNIPVNLITVAQSDSQNGIGSNATALSSSNDNQLYSQNQRSIETGDVFTSTFNLTEVPWVNADDYSGTVTYTATAN